MYFLYHTGLGQRAYWFVGTGGPLYIPWEASEGMERVCVCKCVERVCKGCAKGVQRVCKGCATALHYCLALLPYTTALHYCLALLPYTTALYYCLILLPYTTALNSVALTSCHCRLTHSLTHSLAHSRTHSVTMHSLYTIHSLFMYSLYTYTLTRHSLHSLYQG
jgi:hypothetical protein